MQLVHCGPDRRLGRAIHVEHAPGHDRAELPCQLFGQRLAPHDHQLEAAQSPAAWRGSHVSEAARDGVHLQVGYPVPLDQRGDVIGVRVRLVRYSRRVLQRH